ncbi:hypothetical protein L1I30_04040 [Gillisia sp. M10.2A]|uniref:Peptidase M56 domain-containing protein n=1 Tax=Gillisia lutea TaxID=2909668 RepID=A0ABS9EG51_9FLAO|nr:M56 family metallopeptidase [Gillisia lutea]MCF4100829.1 hypothetical protein [Gillisia lutea]
MELYFLKSAACLGIFFLFYKLILEQENMHVFKRIYLLFSVIASMLIPLITFYTYVEASEAGSLLSQQVIQEIDALHSTGENLDWTFILWSIYFIGVIFFSLKFSKNLGELIFRIKRNPKFKDHDVTNVLLPSKIEPHTFFRYIFLNKKRFERGEIPAEVLLHEQAHARQKHSLDILFIELLQIWMWFNPLIYLVKHAIKLNHEFLADQAVIRKGTPKATYQKILLAFSSNAETSNLASAINYSSIKKRFTVMKTHTSKKGILIRSLLLLPLLAVLLYSFSTNEIVQLEEKVQVEGKSAIADFPTQQEKATKKMIKEYNKLAKHYNSQEVDRIIIKMKDVERMKYIYSLMTPKQREAAEEFPHFPLPPRPEAPRHPERIANVERVARIAHPEPPTAPEPPAPHFEQSEMPSPPEEYLGHDGQREMERVQVIEERKMKIAARNMERESREMQKQERMMKRAERDMQKREMEIKFNTPPPPPVPEIHMKQLAEEGAEFFYNGKSISSEEAIKIVKTNKNININVRKSNNEKPTVKLTTDPIEIN